jgi:hypothetical protein
VFALGALIQVAAILFVVDALRSGGRGLGEHLRHLRWGWAGLGVLAASAGMWWIAVAWWRILNGRDAGRVAGPGAPIPPTDLGDLTPKAQPEDHTTTAAPSLAITTGWYFVGEIGKYVPGGIWPVLGRGELARRGGVPADAAYNSVVWSLAYLLGSGAIIAAPLAPFVAPETGSWAWAGLAVPVLVLVALSPQALGWLARRVPRFGHRIHVPSLADSASSLVFVSVAWVLIAAANELLARSLGFDGSPVRIGVAAIAAWVAGTVAVGVPGGAGVREAVFVTVAGLPKADAALLAILSRLVFVGVDLAGLLLGVGILARARRGQRPRAPVSL